MTTRILLSTVLIAIMLLSGCSRTNKVDSQTRQSSSILENVAADIPLNRQVARLAGVTLSKEGEVRLRYASAPPLVIVDGTPMGVGDGDLSFLSPTEVARVEVIKGPDTIVYGRRGSHGVLKITTKHQAYIDNQ